jgi:rubrerythrin
MAKDRNPYEQIISILEYALEHERQAILRYSEGARLARLTPVRRLMESLAREERQHEARLLRMLDRVRADEKA